MGLGFFGAILDVFVPTPPGTPKASDVLENIGNAVVGAINGITGGGGGSGGGSSTHAATPVTPQEPSPPPGVAYGPQPVTVTPLPVFIGTLTPVIGIPFDPNLFPSTAGRFGGSDTDRINSLCLIDTLQKPPPSVNQGYVEIVNTAATFLGVSHPPEQQELSRATGARPMWPFPGFPEQLFFQNVPGNATITGNGNDSEEKMRNEVNRGRNDVYDVVNRVNAFVARAKNAGFVPPENPFSLAMSYNVGRVGFTPITLRIGDSSKIAANAQAYLKLLAAERAGQLNLDRNVNKAAQLSHSSLSLEGFGGTGNTSLDLAKLLPDADEVKQQKAFEALSVFDFTKRIPKVLFTAFYAPDGVPKGVIVGWKKVADASGYVIKRRNIFDEREVIYSLTNDDVKRDTLRLKEYVRAWILSFYDNIQQDFVVTFLDTDIPPHGYFYYKVQAYQLQNEIPGTIFNVATSPIFLSAPQKLSIKQQMSTLDSAFVNTSNVIIEQTQANAISPYPVLAHVLLGNAKYDWLLAAINIRASINRGDSRTVTRNYSYLSAQLPFLFAQADAGKLVLPEGKNVTTAMKNVEDAVSKYGVNQVLKDVLQETGALYHFEGKDPNDNTLFRNVDSGNATDSGLISVVAAAIDPETATMNLKTLATNLPLLLSGEYIDVRTKLQSGAPATKAPTIGEIEVPPEFDQPDANRAEEDIQYLNKLGNLGDGIVDLTTAEGIATFMRTIRIFSDIGPNRGSPIVTNPTTIHPDPVRVPGAPPPPITPAQPIAAPVFEFIEAGFTANDLQIRQKDQIKNSAQIRKDVLDSKKEQIALKIDPTGKGRGGGFKP